MDNSLNLYKTPLHLLIFRPLLIKPSVPPGNFPIPLFLFSGSMCNVTINVPVLWLYSICRWLSLLRYGSTFFYFIERYMMTIIHKRSYTIHFSKSTSCHTYVKIYNLLYYFFIFIYKRIRMFDHTPNRYRSPVLEPYPFPEYDIGKHNKWLQRVNHMSLNLVTEQPT